MTERANTGTVVNHDNISPARLHFTRNVRDLQPCHHKTKLILSLSTLCDYVPP